MHQLRIKSVGISHKYIAIDIEDILIWNFRMREKFTRIHIEASKLLYLTK